MFSNRKRPFPFSDLNQESASKEKKCLCPLKSVPDRIQYTNNVEQRTCINNTESHLDMETESTNGCNNNVPSEYDRNIHILQPKQQNCRQCLAGQGGHFMHIITDGNNNT